MTFKDLNKRVSLEVTQQQSQLTDRLQNNLLFSVKCLDLAYAITMFCTAVGLFLLGHRVEGNLKAIALIVLFKYIVRSRKSTVSALTNN